ncbi:MAG: hypothetical protein ACRD6W_11970 [Nitrososphaerales archaeon]
MTNPYNLAWWEAAEIGLWAEEIPVDAVKAFRKNAIRRGGDIRAREFDNALSGAYKATHREVKESNRVIRVEPLIDHLDEKIRRAAFHMGQNLPPVFVRPRGYVYTMVELDTIASARARDQEPSFLEFSDDGIDRVPGPSTGGSEWAGVGFTEESNPATL